MHDVIDAASHDRVFDTAFEIISPYLLDPKDILDETDSKNLRRGISMLEAVIRFNPGNFPAHYIASKAYDALNEPENAYPLLKRGFDLDRTDSEVAKALSEVCMRLEKSDEAIEFAKHAALLAPNDQLASLNLALSFYAAGRNEEALETAEAALSHAHDAEMKEILLEVVQMIKLDNA